MIPSKQILKGQMATLVNILVGINDSFSDFSPFLFYDPLCVQNMTVNVFLSRVGRDLESKIKLGVNFINVLRANFSYKTSFRQLFLVTFWIWGAI